MDWSVNWWAVVVATVVYFAWGAVGYGFLFGNAWAAAIGKSRAELAGGQLPIKYTLTIALEFLAVLTLAILLANAPVSGWLQGAGFGALVAFGVWVTLIGVTFINESRRPLVFLIDGGFVVVGFAICGAILGGWV